VLQAIGIFAIATIGWATAGLYIGCTPRLGTDRAQEGCRVKGAGAHFHVVGLLQDTALLGPVVLEGEDQVLKGRGRLAINGL